VTAGAPGPVTAGAPAPVGLVTYSVKPRGGVVHTLALAEALHAAGYPVRVIALGDPAAGFFRPVAAPFTIIEAPPSLPTLEERVFANVDALAAGLGGLVADLPILHTQDCISARAAVRVRDAAAGPPPVVVRTVHHVDDFTSPSLIDCQRQAILEPDRILVVSERWREILAEDYGTSADVVHNGVDVARFRSADPDLVAALRQRAGAGGVAGTGDRPLILAVGGIEPRKGSDTLVAAVAALSRPGGRSGGRSGRRPVLAVVGGHSFQDYREYRKRVLASLPGLGLRLDDDVVLLGTVPDAELPGWYAAADVLAFPSTKEGWGLAVLEAMSAGLPVVASDLPVFREYLRPGQDALMVPVDNAAALTAALGAVLDDAALAGRLRTAGYQVCARFTWDRCAAEHQRIYADLKWR
jgi:glycosyltransferase-like protein